MILYEDGVKIGEVSEWKLIERFPEKKNILGKEILTAKPKDQCTFVSPKAVKRKKTMWLISPEKEKFTLSEINVMHGTFITATVVERKRL